ncbi:hypothetical protein YC2023_050718 [Brassica napus]
MIYLLHYYCVCILHLQVVSERVTKVTGVILKVKMDTIVSVQKAIMLKADQYGHWKARMKQMIQGINEDAWTAVKIGWEEPAIVTGDGKKPKPKDDWSEGERNASKFKAKALSVIFGAVEAEQFQLIQGSTSAKEAWEIMLNSFEGDVSVKRTRLDHLGSQFENLRWSDNDSVASFSAKLSGMAHEAFVLGKKYKEKKLVKKLLRYLPTKFGAHKAVLNMTTNTNELKFDKLVGMLKAEEMKTNNSSVYTSGGASRSIALAANKDGGRSPNVEDAMGMLARNLGKMLNSSGGRNQYGRQGGDRGNSRRRERLRCYECESVGHIKVDCPVAQRRKLKCSECRGVGHTRRECPNSKKEKCVLLQSSDDSESEEDGKVMKNLVAFGACKEESSESSDSNVDTDSEDYHVLLNKWLNLKNENLRLQHDLVQSREENEELAEELAAVHEKNESLEQEVGKPRKVATGEQERARMLERDLADNRKQIMMLNSGTKDLDKILSMGQPAKVNWGLGYRGAESTKEVQQKGLSHFVQGSTSKSGAKEACQEVRQDVR